MRTSLRIGVLGGVLAISLSAPALAVKDGVTFVSRAPGLAGFGGDGDSQITDNGWQADHVISSDGSKVLFDSRANNVFTGDLDGGTRNVFLRDLTTGVNVMVDRASGQAGLAANAESEGASMTQDGRWVVFSSGGTNLSPDDKTLSYDVYLRDVVQGTTQLVSRADGVGGPVGDKHSQHPAVSRFGRYVAFTSQATNLIPGGVDTNGVRDVYVRDTIAGTTRLISRQSGADGPLGTKDAGEPVISADGRFVAFSTASTLTPDAPKTGWVNAYVRDLKTNATLLISRLDGPNGTPGNQESRAASISDSGSKVAFTSNSTNFPEGATTPTWEDAYVRDLSANTLTLVSRATGPAGAIGNLGAERVALSGDGRFASFFSHSTNLSSDDNHDTHAGDIFVRDLAQSTTSFVSRATGPQGVAANAESFEPAISATGRFVAFATKASNLSADAKPAFSNVFLRDLTGP